MRCHCCILATMTAHFLGKLGKIFTPPASTVAIVMGEMSEVSLVHLLSLLLLVQQRQRAQAYSLGLAVPNRYPTYRLPLVRAKKELRASARNSLILLLIIGGPERNRTTDTRIFNP